MQAVAIGAFHDQHVGPIPDGDWVADDRQSGAANIPAEYQPDIPLFFVVFNIQDHAGTAQHMAGIHQGQGHARQELLRAVVGAAHKLAHRLYHVFLGVEWFKQIFALRPAFLVGVLNVTLLDMGAVLQHHGAQIARGRGGNDIAPEAALHQAGNVAGMINVGMGEDERINRGSVKGRLPVALKGFLALTLKEAAIQQNTVSVHFDQML